MSSCCTANTVDSTKAQSTAALIQPTAFQRSAQLQYSAARG